LTWHHGGHLAASAAFDLSQLPAGWQPIPRRVPTSDTDTNQSTLDTVLEMVRLVHRDAASWPNVRAVAERLGRWGRGPVGRRITWEVFWFVKHRVRYLSDDWGVLGLCGETGKIDYLVSPPVLLAMRRPAGDCDDFSMLIAALLESHGIDWEIVTVAVDRADPERWSHVYVRALLPEGPLALDAVSGDYPGWEVPAHDVFRRQSWNRKGEPVPYVSSIRPRVGLQGYRRGFGQAADVQEGGTYVPPPPTDSYPTPSSILSYGTPPSSSGINWGSILSSLTAAGTRLGQEALLPSGASLTPSGAIISAPGAAAGLLTPGVGIGGISFTTILLIGALAVGLIAVAGSHR
jgi:hypothetical protein